MKALIHPLEIVNNYDGSSGALIAQISDQEFEVAPPLFWVDCDNSINENTYYYDLTTNTFKEKVFPPPPPKVPKETQPIIEGLDTV